MKRLDENGYTGINLDFEPTATATAQDAQNYANFLEYMGQRLNAHGKKLSFDFATWNAVWNWDLLSQQSQIGEYFLMSTYTGFSLNLLTQLKPTLPFSLLYCNEQ